MQVKMSSYLNAVKPKIKELVALLEQDFEYVSVLATDVFGVSYQVGQRNTSVHDYDFAERGFVVRVYQNDVYSEYSFNECENVTECANTIRNQLKSQLSLLEACGIEKMESPLIHEEAMIQTFMNEVEEDSDTLSAEDVLSQLKAISDQGAQKENIIEFLCSVHFAHVNKMYLSSQKDLMQSYETAEGMMACMGKNAEKSDMTYHSFSGMKGAEILKEMPKYVEEVWNNLDEKLSAEPPIPGVYDVITTPEVTGLIAHEAFGHGVEMDMFVKKRALAEEYMGKEVASSITCMKDGAKSAVEVSSYLFDDEGTLGGDTTIIENGILKNGISDVLSALRLHTVPTGNGKRESFERKAYARMTNTLFTRGNATKEEMIASIQHGYLLEGMDSGMEDPKHWGIQCVVAMGREIKDGKFTGKIIAPVTLTGYVPDLLKSISMISDDMEMSGSGACGKGHKEWVKVSEGGPYLKCKARLG